MPLPDLRAKHLPDIFAFTVCLLQLFERYPGSVTSWLRSNARNRHVGGLKHSLHLLGTAADIVLDKPEDNRHFVAYARVLGLDAVDETDHVHVELDRTHLPKT